MDTELQLSQFGAQCSLDFCLWGWVKNEIDRRKVDTRDELLARFLDADANIKKHKDQLRRATHCLGTQLAKCTELHYGIFEHLL
jgi:hypothetical protein